MHYLVEGLLVVVVISQYIYFTRKIDELECRMAALDDQTDTIYKIVEWSNKAIDYLTMANKGKLTPAIKESYRKYFTHALVTGMTTSHFAYLISGIRNTVVTILEEIEIESEQKESKK